MKITIVEVAKKAGVSVATVSRVMNGNYPVSKLTREKVLAAIEDLQFIPNMQARELINKKSMTVGVIVPSVDNMFFPEVITGIEDYLNKKGYSLILNCSKNSKRQERNCVSDLLSRNVAGIIIADPDTSNVASEYYRGLTKRVPIIFINGNAAQPEFGYVCSNEELGAADAIRYLKENNHQRIAFVRGDNSYSYDVKEKVFRKMMSKELSFTESSIISVGNGNSSQVIDNTCDLLLPILQARTFSAILACNDLMAIGIISACRKLEISIPEEMSLIGCDNIILSRYMEPKLTTIDQHMFLLGYTAAELMMEKICSKQDYNKKVVLNTTLVKRESVGYNNND